MSRYIDIEPYEKDGWYLQKTYYDTYGAGVKTTPLKSVPTAEPTKHGRWIVNNETKEWVTIYCDQCHDGMWNRKGDPYPNYCFNCGADMREVEE